MLGAKIKARVITCCRDICNLSLIYLYIYVCNISHLSLLKIELNYYTINFN